jgi:MATE family multidrug resistance protein
MARQISRAAEQADDGDADEDEDDDDDDDDMDKEDVGASMWEGRDTGADQFKNRRRRVGSYSARPGRDPSLGARFARRENANRKANDATSRKSKAVSALNLNLRPVFGKEEFREVIQLAIPALGSLLADPLMSLIDTAVVGQHSSTSLAALGPNTAVFQIVFQLFSFLSITTTGMVARACADGDNKTVRRALANSTILALTFGGATCLGLNLFSAQVLQAMGCSPDLVVAAMPYLKIRAFAIPAVLFCTSAQGGCLGQQDARTPLLIFLVAGLINGFGDFWAVQPWGLDMGLKGAAYATLAAQYISAAIFFIVLTRRRMLPVKWKHWRLPSMNEMRDITAISGMLLLGSLCRMGVYTMMTMTALALGTMTMAAHQVALQIFWTLTYFVDPLFVAATSFIARDHGRRPVRVRRMAWLLMGLSLGVGAVISIACVAVPTFGVQIFTSDVELQGLIRQITPLMGLSQLISALVLVTEGVLIGCGDLRYLLNVHCLNFVVLGSVLWGVRMTSGGLYGIWVAVFLNQAMRMMQHAVHMWRGGGPDLFARKQQMLKGEGEGI